MDPLFLGVFYVIPGCILRLPWIIPEVYRKGFSVPLDSMKSVRVIDTDSKKWDEFSNLSAMVGLIARQPHSNNLRQQLNMAKELINTIKKEYHLE